MDSNSKTTTLNTMPTLPSGWRWVRLGEVLEIIESGSRPKGGVFEIKEGIPSIGAEHLNSLGGFNFDNLRFIPKEFYERMNRGKIQKGDVLVVKDGATTGKVSFIRDDFPYNKAAINEHVFRLRGKEFLEQEFLFWFLYSPLGQAQIQQEFHGAAQGGINQQFVNGVEILVPSLVIQRRIAQKIQELMDDIARAKSACEKQLEAAKALPSAYLREVFESEEAKKWERKRLGEVCEKIIGGGTPSRGHPEYWEGSIYWLSPSELDEDKLNYVSKTKETITESGSNNSNAKIVPTKSVLLSCTASVGKVAINEVPLTTNQQFNSFVLRNTIAIPEFVAYYFLYIKEDIKQMGGKTTFTFISKDEIADIYLPCAPLDVQYRIAADLKQKMTQAENLQSKIYNLQSAIEALPQAILRKAFRGEL